MRNWIIICIGILIFYGLSDKDQIDYAVAVSGAIYSALTQIFNWIDG